ncbi:MAG: hypothetical protein ACJARX_000089 [Psychroserpens sp.]|jgi:hypothetical protein|uniref:hypothetical protein n=1 Tax=Psychroserpens sp. TaxID=2020870 RepID=UPI0039E30C94
MKLKLTIVALCLCVFNCKQDSNTKTHVAAFDYKYPNVEKLVDCRGIDTRLLQEAMQSFETDIANFYTPEKPVLFRAYREFINNTISNTVDYSALVSHHSKKVLEALKQDEALWVTNPDGSNINYSHPLFKCIGKNIKDESLQTTFNALIDTNSMSLRIFSAPLRNKSFGMKDDKYLATYVALALFYGKIYDKDLNANALNTVQPTLNDDHTNHDGHNH